MSAHAYATIMGSEHWETYVVKIVELHGEVPIVTVKCGVYFVTGFIRGFQYGIVTKSDQVLPMVFARTHWWSEELPILEARHEDPGVINKCKVHYQLAFIHGFKHGKEAVEFHL